MKPLTEQTPREIDTELAKLYGKHFEATLDMQNAAKSLERTRERSTGQPWHVREIEECAQRLARLIETREALANEMHPLNDEFRRRGGWHRYYLVPGGHVHREMRCSTCFPTTRFGWLPELSDCDENAMVEVHGDNACAVCFPAVQNHPAFLRAREARLAMEAAEASKLCPASGTYARAGGFHRFVKCPTCGRGVHVTRNGKFRKHMKKEG